MIVLPVIDRELRVWARNSGTYWGRFAVALCALAVCTPQLGAFSWLGVGPSMLGKYAFNGLVAAAFLLSCCACFLTCDSISMERREGTLPLLLLTPLGPFDVVLGKLSSSGLACLCSVVALLPVLMLPVLAGGVTGGEVLRKGLACLNALFFALAVGLYQSALAREKFRAGVLAGLTLAGFLFLPFATELFRLSGMPSLSFLSPLENIISAGDAKFRSEPSIFFASLISVQIFAWVLLKRAAVRLADTDRRESAREGNAVTPSLAGPPPIQRKTSWQAESSPVSWLFRRQRGIHATLWVAAMITFFYQGGWAVVRRFPFYGGSPAYWVMIQAPTIVFSLITGALIAWAASRFSFDLRRNGELELLLTTPAGVKTFVQDQWAALKRLLVGPVIVMLLPFLMRALNPRIGWPMYGLFTFIGALNVVLGVVALCWTGMWFGFTAQRQTRAVIFSVGLVKGGPLLLNILLMVFYSVAFSAGSPWSYQFATLVAHTLILLFYLRIIKEAKRRLNGRLRNDGPTSLGPLQSLFDASRSITAGFKKARHWTPGDQ